ncbi:hypothetical protein DFQ11_10116 [Winogradskyella epiphytica]|uniref:Uncharacterized protein n=1 Tax=Winogradskyella epiphytica TaxID=262005 RepID=A0A2V4XGI5_9FLAO|nr:hypothetical protein [Winogradskyella epiphytica]PYE82591.1 hypothetical protein DFQ11_10116 [Winogradskyella epiphytica]GGW72112.1 hypothetical protein GCM10008085_25340 [Winogradskyella epiphytica]
MKKIIYLLFSLALVTSCDNEPLDPDLMNGGGASENPDLGLYMYELDTKINFSFFGTPFETVTNSDLMITNNKFVSSSNAVSTNGSPFITENQTLTRNSSGKITSDVSVNASGTTTNETLITYTNGRISQISYNYYGDDEDDFIYNFAYEGNTITRTEQGSTISTIFTTDGSNRIIKKESFDDGNLILKETIAYNAIGNITSSTTTGETNNNVIYQFDNQTNPLKVVYEDNYLLRFLADDYSDEIGTLIAQFLSTNNWTSATFNGDAFNFDLEYNSAGRIQSRKIAYNLGPELSFEFNERFNYIN